MSNICIYRYVCVYMRAYVCVYTDVCSHFYLLIICTCHSRVSLLVINYKCQYVRFPDNSHRLRY